MNAISNCSIGANTFISGPLALEVVSHLEQVEELYGQQGKDSAVKH